MLIELALPDFNTQRCVPWSVERHWLIFLGATLHRLCFFAIWHKLYLCEGTVWTLWPRIYHPFTWIMAEITQMEGKNIIYFNSIDNTL